MSESVVVGNRVRITVEIIDGSPATGTRIRVRKRGGAATETELGSVTVDGATATADYTAAPGTYDFRAWRTTAPVFAVEGEFTVTDSALAADPA